MLRQVGSSNENIGHGQVVIVQLACQDTQHLCLDQNPPDTPLAHVWPYLFTLIEEWSRIMKGCLVPLWVVLVVGTLTNGESITDFLRSRADLSQVNSCQSRDITWGKLLQNTIGCWTNHWRQQQFSKSVQWFINGMKASLHDTSLFWTWNKNMLQL